MEIKEETCKYCHRKLEKYNCRKMFYAMLYMGVIILSKSFSIYFFLGLMAVFLVFLYDKKTQKVAFKMLCLNDDCIAVVNRCKTSEMG